MRPSSQTHSSIALYFFVEVLPISRRSSKALRALLWYFTSASTSSKVFLFSVVTDIPHTRFRYSFSWVVLFGFSSPVSSFASVSSCALYSSSKRVAFSANWRSNNTPRSLILWSMVYSSSSKAAGSNLRTLANICCSTSTSRILYCLNNSQRSGASAGRCLFPLVGVEK